MRRDKLFLVLAVLLVVGLAWFFLRGPRSGDVAIDLMDRFPQAERRSNVPDLGEAFRDVTLTIDGEAKRGIFMHPTSRLTFKNVTVPDDAWLRVAVAIDPAKWEGPSDGVLFRFGVSDGRTYDELVKQFVDPSHNSNDRRWIPFTVDLSAYAGQDVDLVFSTNSSLPGRGDDPRNDWAIWGAPEIFTGR